MIVAILHADKNWGIGKNNGLMFSLPLDMKFFRETTTGKTVAMGGKTLRSFPNGKPLKNRTNIVLTRGQGCGECICAHDFSEFKRAIKEAEGEDKKGEVYVIGGGEIYRAMLLYCEKVLVTKVDADGGADVFFPDLDTSEKFRLESESEEIKDNGYAIRFLTYVNLNPLPL